MKAGIQVDENVDLWARGATCCLKIYNFKFPRISSSSCSSRFTFYWLIYNIVIDDIVNMFNNFCINK